MPEHRNPHTLLDIVPIGFDQLLEESPLPLFHSSARVVQRRDLLRPHRCLTNATIKLRSGQMSHVIGIDHSSAVRDFAILACGVRLAKNHYQETNRLLLDDVILHGNPISQKTIPYLTSLELVSTDQEVDGTTYHAWGNS